jgi:hypothetical protein
MFPAVLDLKKYLCPDRSANHELSAVLVSNGKALSEYSYAFLPTSAA